MIYHQLEYAHFPHNTQTLTTTRKRCHRLVPATDCYLKDIQTQKKTGNCDRSAILTPQTLNTTAKHNQPRQTILLQLTISLLPITSS